LSGATLRVFPHNHLGKLESHLEWARREYPAGRIVIVTEAVFSIDGDRAPLRELVELKKRFQAFLLSMKRMPSAYLVPTVAVWRLSLDSRARSTLHSAHLASR
jgi:hypothetical protein